MKLKLFYILLIYFMLFSFVRKICADSIIVDGIERNFLIHLPSDYQNNKSYKIPLVIALHGGGGKGKGMNRLTRFNDVADKYSFVVLYPDGIKKGWNDGREINKHIINGKEIDDVKFLSQLIDTLIDKYNIDPSRVFVTGISNGGIMSFRLACEITNKIAGIASVAASMTEYEYNNCKPSASIPVMIVFGNEDPLVPFDGGEIKGKRGKVVSVSQTVDFWKKHNQCYDKAVIDTVIDNYDDGTRAEHYGFHGNSNVEFWLILGGGHTWPGGWQYLPKLFIGRTSKEINVSEEIWKFFSDKKLQK